MTIRDKHIAQKKKEIEKIEKQQERLLKKIVAIPTKPSKRKYINFLRLAKRFAIAHQINSLEMQKQMIIARPIPKGNGFVTDNPAIVSESGPEYIVISESGPIDENAFKKFRLGTWKGREKL
jgi:hypothetical protein